MKAVKRQMRTATLPFPFTIYRCFTSVPPNLSVKKSAKNPPELDQGVNRYQPSIMTFETLPNKTDFRPAWDLRAPGCSILRVKPNPI